MLMSYIALTLVQVLLGSDAHHSAVKALNAGNVEAASKTWLTFLGSEPDGVKTVELRKVCGEAAARKLCSSIGSPYSPLFVLKEEGKDCYHVCFGLSAKGAAAPVPPKRVVERSGGGTPRVILLASVISSVKGGVITGRDLVKYHRRESNSRSSGLSNEDEEESSGPRLPSGYEMPPEGSNIKEQVKHWKAQRAQAFADFDDTSEEYATVAAEIDARQRALANPKTSSDAKKRYRGELPKLKKELQELAKATIKAKEDMETVDTIAAEFVDSGEITAP